MINFVNFSKNFCPSNLIEYFVREEKKRKATLSSVTRIQLREEGGTYSLSKSGRIISNPLKSGGGRSAKRGGGYPWAGLGERERERELGAIVRAEHNALKDSAGNLFGATSFRAAERERGEERKERKKEKGRKKEEKREEEEEEKKKKKSQAFFRPGPRRRKLE